MSRTIRLPFYARATVIMIGCYVLVTILIVAQGIILPVIYATIIAILVSPLVHFLVRRRVPRGLAILIVSLIAIVLLAGLLALIISQANQLSRSLPQFVAKVEELFSQTMVWISGILNVPLIDIDSWLAQSQDDFIQKSSGRIGMTITTVGGAITTILLTPVYIVMLLFYQSHLREFLQWIFRSHEGIEINDILFKTKKIIQSYLTGLFFEFLIVATLNSIGLLIIGIEYAILLAITASVLNVIPYVGAMAGVGMYMIVALVTEEPIYVLYVFILYMVIQFLDNNFIIPKIVGSKVKLNALVSFFAVIVGAGLWGIPGMLLSIPMVAVLKLIFDHIEPMKAWGFLLGETLPETHKAEAPSPQ